MAQVKYGTGSIFKLKDGRYKWQGFYVDAAGKRHRPSRTFLTEEQALKYQAEQYNKAEVKRAKNTANLTVDDVFNMWKHETSLGIIKQSETTIKNTIANYDKHIKNIVGDNYISNINTLRLQRYFNKLKNEGKSDKTIYNIYTDFKKIIRLAQKKKYIFDDVCENLEITKPSTKKETVNILTSDEYDLLVHNPQNMEYYYYPLILFLCETGLRISELAIKEEDIKETADGLTYAIIKRSIKRILKDAENSKETKVQIIEDLKTDKSFRKIPLNTNAQYAVFLQKQQKEKLNITSSFVFCNIRGGLLEQRNILRDFHKMLKNAEIEQKGLHSLRKYYINKTLSNGVQPFDLAKITGHSMQTMFKYYHDVDFDTLKKISDASE